MNFSQQYRLIAIAVVMGVISPPARGEAQTIGQVNANLPAPVRLDYTATYEGFTHAIDEVLLGSEETGRLITSPPQVGESIEKGQVVASLDDAMQAASVAVAEVQALMTGEIESARASVRLQTIRVDQLESLAQQSMAGPDELRRGIVELEVAEARLKAALEQQDLRETELARLRLQQQRRHILAPFDGIVAERLLSAGAVITPANYAVVRLVRIDVLEAVFNVDSVQATAMEVGLPVEVYLRAARRTVNARVVSLSPVINGESGTVQMRVRIDNPDRTLRPGDRCTMRLRESDPSEFESVEAAASPSWSKFRR